LDNGHKNFILSLLILIKGSSHVFAVHTMNPSGEVEV